MKSPRLLTRPDFRFKTPAALVLRRHIPICLRNAGGRQFRINLLAIIIVAANHSINDKISHVNALGTQIARQRLTQQSLRTLVRRKARRNGFAPQRRRGARDEQHALSVMDIIIIGCGGRCCQHAGHHGLTDGQQSGDVGLKARLKFGVFELLPRLKDAIAGIVQDGINRSELSGNGGNGRLDIVGLRHVARKALALFSELGRGGLHLFLGARQDGDLISFLQPLDGQGLTQTGSKSKDGSNLHLVVVLVLVVL
mmetsp:Transcript_16356/g.37698  ORF Transcript_16356/g.37698 Transcript_16356/m.37698 type:complete len:254 (-) Transcript_16356:543-1304(-)